MTGNHMKISMKMFLLAGIGCLLGISFACSPGMPEPVTYQFETTEDTFRLSDLERTGTSVNHRMSEARDVSLRDSEEYMLGDDQDGQTLQISLREAILLSLGENRDLLVERMNPKIQRARVRQTLGQFNPTTYANGSLAKNKRPVGSALEPGVQRLNEKRLGLRGETPFGTTYDFSMGLIRDDNNNIFRTVNPQYRSDYGLTVEQPLLKDRGTDANLASYRARIHELKKSHREYQARVNDIIHRVTVAYWDYVNALEQKKVAESATELASETVEVNRARFEANRIPEVDLLQARTRLSEAEEQMIVTENSIQNQRDALLQLISPPGVDPEEWQVDIQPVSSPEIRDRTLNEERLIQEALRKRPELKAVEEQMKTVREEIEQSENQMMPELDLQLSYGFNSLGDDRSESFEELEEGEFQEWRAGLMFSYPIGNTTANARLREQKLRLRQLNMQKKQIETRVTMEVRQAVRAMRSARSQVETAEKSRELSREQLDAEMARQKLGLSTTFQVLQLQRDAVDASARLINAKTRYEKAQSELKNATGELVSSYLK